MAHSTVELPNLFQIGTTHSTVPLTHTFQDIAPSAVELSSAISGHRPFQLGVVHSTMELPRSVSGHFPFQIGMADSTVLGYCPFQLCFSILPLSNLFQDIAPFTSFSGYCPFELCFRILPL